MKIENRVLTITQKQLFSVLNPSEVLADSLDFDIINVPLKEYKELRAVIINTSFILELRSKTNLNLALIKYDLSDMSCYIVDLVTATVRYLIKYELLLSRNCNKCRQPKILQLNLNPLTTNQVTQGDISKLLKFLELHEIQEDGYYLRLSEKYYDIFKQLASVFSLTFK